MMQIGDYHLCIAVSVSQTWLYFSYYVPILYPIIPSRTRFCFSSFFLGFAVLFVQTDLSFE